MSIFDLTGKTAIITGANTGLGQGMCIALAQAGANIVGVSRSDMSETQKMVEEIGVPFLPVHADLLTLELTGANPTVRFRIKNVPSVEIPTVEYNGDRYGLHQVDDEVYESDPLVVSEHIDTISLVIGNVIRHFKISVSTGAQEEDLFGGF